VQSFRCVDLVPTKADTQLTDKVNFRFSLTPEVQNVTITGYRFSFSNSNEVVDTTADTPFVETRQWVSVGTILASVGCSG
jgi:hypothetical protein